GIEVLTPQRPREPEFLDRLRELAPDSIPVVAYGALVPPAALGIPRHGWVNLHFSLLPAWRGAAPVQHAIMAGDEVTGASTCLLAAALDTGTVYGTVTEAIAPRDTAGDLLGRLAVSGAGLLVATLDGIEAGTLVAEPQPAEGISLAPRSGTPASPGSCPRTWSTAGSGASPRPPAHGRRGAATGFGWGPWSRSPSTAS